MSAAENDPPEGKRKCEALWPIFKMNHQRSLYLHDLYYNRKEDRNLIAKWMKMQKQKNECESSPGERTPFKDLTNKGADETKLAKQGSGTNWYGRLSGEKKEEHLKKLRIAREQKKIAAISIGKFEESSQIPDQGEHTPCKDQTNKFNDQNLEHQRHITALTQGEHTPSKEQTDKFNDKNLEHQRHITALTQGPTSSDNLESASSHLMDRVSPSLIQGPGRLNFPDGDEDKPPIPVHIMPTDPRELVDELCKHIMSIQDAKCLEKEWVRSSKPYQIGLSLEKIQNILRMDKPMDNDCFNLGIRIVACDAILHLVETDVHYMDLRFCKAMGDSTQGQKWRIKPNIQSLAMLFDSWLGTDYKISSCKLVLLPYASMRHFTLFSIDKHASCVTVFYPFSVSPSPESKMIRTHNMQLKLQRISIYLDEALALAQPGWNADIFSWPRRSPVGIPESPDMVSWTGKELVHPVCMDVYELRKNFLVHLLKYHVNEVEDNIPNIVRQYVRSIKE